LGLGEKPVCVRIASESFFLEHFLFIYFLIDIIYDLRDTLFIWTSFNLAISDRYINIFLRKRNLMNYGKKMTMLNVLCVIGLSGCATFSSAMDRKPTKENKTTTVILRNDSKFIPELKETVAQAQAMGQPNLTHPQAIVRRAERNPEQASIPFSFEPAQEFPSSSVKPATQRDTFVSRKIVDTEGITRLQKEEKKAESLARAQSAQAIRDERTAVRLAVRQVEVTSADDFQLEEEVVKPKATQRSRSRHVSHTPITQNTTPTFMDVDSNNYSFDNYVSASPITAPHTPATKAAQASSDFSAKRPAATRNNSESNLRIAQRNDAMTKNPQYTAQLIDKPTQKLLGIEPKKDNSKK